MKRQLLSFCGVYALGVCTVLIFGNRPSIDSQSQHALQTESAQESVAVQLTSLSVEPSTDAKSTKAALYRRQSRASVWHGDVDQDAPVFQPLSKGTDSVDPVAMDPVAMVSDTTLAQSDPFSAPGPDYNSDPRQNDVLATPLEPSDLDIESLALPTPSDEDQIKLAAALREQLHTLAKSKADLLNEKSLIAEIARLQREIANLNAARKLLDAQQILQKMIDEFPESPAAGRAKTMLKPQPAGNGIRVLPGTRLVPMPDPGYGRQS